MDIKQQLYDPNNSSFMIFYHYQRRVISE